MSRSRTQSPLSRAAPIMSADAPGDASSCCSRSRSWASAIGLQHRQKDHPSDGRTLEAPTDAVVDTLRLAPGGFRQTRVAVRLVSPERLDPLLHDRAIGLGRHAGAMSARANAQSTGEQDGARVGGSEEKAAPADSHPFAVRWPPARADAAAPSLVSLRRPQRSVAPSEPALTARSSQRELEAALPRRASR